jgi:hypothetical protein
VLRGDDKAGLFLNGRQVVPAADCKLAGANDVTALSGVLLDDLVRCLRDGREPETTGADNLWTMGTCQAAFDSYHRRQAVNVEELVASAWEQAAPTDALASPAIV